MFSHCPRNKLRARGPPNLADHLGPSPGDGPHRRPGLQTSWIDHRPSDDATLLGPIDPGPDLASFSISGSDVFVQTVDRRRELGLAALEALCHVGRRSWLACSQTASRSSSRRRETGCSPDDDVTWLARDMARIATGRWPPGTDHTAQHGRSGPVQVWPEVLRLVAGAYDVVTRHGAPDRAGSIG